MVKEGGGGIKVDSAFWLEQQKEDVVTTNAGSPLAMCSAPPQPGLGKWTRVDCRPCPLGSQF